MCTLHHSYGQLSVLLLGINLVRENCMSEVSQLLLFTVRSICLKFRSVE